MLLLILLIWLICSVLTYGFSFGLFQREFPCLAVKGYKEDMRISLFFALFGPFGLIGLFLAAGFKHGMKFR